MSKCIIKETYKHIIHIIPTVTSQFSDSCKNLNHFFILSRVEWVLYSYFAENSICTASANIPCYLSVSINVYYKLKQHIYGFALLFLQWKLKHFTNFYIHIRIWTCTSILREIHGKHIVGPFISRNIYIFFLQFFHLKLTNISAST